MSAEHGRAPRSADQPWSVIEVAPEIEPLAAEWDALADRAGADPFARPGWVAAWMRSFAPPGRLGVVVLRGEGRLRAVVPLLRRGAVTRSPTNEHTPRFRLLGEDDAAVDELARVVLRLRQRRLSLVPVHVEDRTLAAIRSAAGAAGHRVIERVALRSPFVPLAGVAEAGDVLDRRRRKDLRRCRRRLEEQGDLVISVERGGPGLEEVLAGAFAVEERQWKGEDGTAITSSPRTHAFYLEVSRWAARAGTLRLLSMRLDGRMIAFELCLLDSTGLYSLKAGFDPDHRRFSPGHLLALAAIDEALAAGVATYELLGDDEPYKMAWTERVRELLSVDVSPATPAGTAEHVRLRYLRPVRRRVATAASSLRPAGR